MKRIMIVDDEVLVRIGIQSLLKWEDHGYEIVCDASDGGEALEKISRYQPDIVLTDLKMDPVDGFELIEKSRTRFPNIQFIVLSSYNDFDNVKRAMKLGAFDYIFKLTVKPQELLEILEEAARNIKASNQSSGLSIVSDKHLDVLKKDVLKRMITSGSYLNTHLEELKRLPVKIDFSQPLSTLYLTIDNFEIVRRKGDFLELELLLFTMENIIEELFNRNYDAEVVQVEKYDFVVILNCGDVRDFEVFAAAMEKEFFFFCNYARQYYGIEVSGALCSGGSGFDGLKVAIKRNGETMKRRFFSVGGQLYRYQRTIPAAVNLPEEYQTTVLKQFADSQDFYAIEQFLERFFDFLGRNDMWEPDDVRRLLRNVYRTLAHSFSAYQIELDSYVDRNGAGMETAIRDYSYLDKIVQSMQEVLEQCRESCESNRGGRMRREVAAVKSFVAGHLKEEISIPEIAAMVSMSTSHFSHIFKKEEGISFMEYVYQLRMERAQELLRSSDLKVNEVAEQIGISNSNYFSTQFKKRTGNSPLEFRQKCLSDSRI